MNKNKIKLKKNKPPNKKNKSISPIISVILLTIVMVIIILIVLFWGKNFSSNSLTETSDILKKDSSLTGFINPNNINPSNYNIKNLSDKNVTIVSYKIIGGGDYEVLDKELTLSNPVNIIPGGSTVLPILCAPDNSFIINLITDEGKYIEVPIKNINSQLNPCNSNSVPDLVCLGLEENGTGDTNDDPFVICTVDDLNNIRIALNKYYKLGINLDLNVSPYNDGNSWEPIGICGPLGFECYIGDYSYLFSKTFDGNGHIIKNLYINNQAANSVGLFRWIGPTTEIKNLGLEDINIMARMAAGGLVIVNYLGTISNCYSTGEISTSGNFAGGLVAFNQGTIDYSYSTSNVDGNNSIGGLVGRNDKTITNSYSTGTISGESTIGGLVGHNYNQGVVSQSYSTSTVIGDYNIGGLIGDNTNDTNILDCNSSGIVSGESVIGGLVGYLESGIISNSNSSSNVSGESVIGGLVGYLESGTISNSNSSSNVTGTLDNIGGLVGKNSQAGDILSSSSSGTISGRYFIGGLVGLNYGDINKSFSSSQVSGTKAIGGLVGLNASNIFNNYSLGTVSGQQMIGGLVGQNFFSGVVSLSYSNSLVSGSISDDFGGLVGDNSNLVSNSFYDTNTSGQSDTGKGTPKTTTQMKAESTFTDWDFVNIWDINEGTSYPFLR